jgi:hypothetical protein
MELMKFLDTKLVDCLDRYSSTQESVGSNLLKVLNKLENAEIIIPVLGTQGMGKSTLINGLLRENILPNDADETTCVPVEVKFGTEECAKVHFFDKTEVITVHTREELNEYVDNNYNPANEKHVANIELFRNNKMLENGLVIVDLPGVGSLTKENENTTKKYVENLCSAIFVIPTVPTIRKKEALFIKSLWSQFSKAIFVQNDWGETQAEKQESLEFNNKVLRDIAEELHNPYDNEIIIVNAYNAISGALRKDEKMFSDSNIMTLYDKIMQLSNNWETERKKVLVSRLRMSIECSKAFIQQKLAEIGKTREEIQIENDKKVESFNSDTIRLKEKVNSLKAYLREEEENMRDIASEKSSECAKKIRSEIYRVIDGGVYDGEKLSEAFSHIQEQEINDFANDITDIFLNIKFEVESKFDEISEIEFESSMNVHSFSIETKESLKWEKGASVGLNLAGAGLATIAAATGPAGWVAYAIGVAVFGVCRLFGWGVKKIKQNSRASEAKKQVAPLIEDLRNQLNDEMIAKYSELKSSCDSSLDGMLKYREEEGRRFKESLSVVVDESQELALKADWDYINNKQKEIENV